MSLPLLNALPGRIVRLVAGQTLFSAGQAPEALYRIDKGLVRLTRDGATIHRAGPGDLFGEVGLFRATWDATATAIGATTVTAYPRHALLLVMKAHPDLAVGFAAWMAARLDQARAEAEILRIKGADARILAAIAQAGGRLELDGPLLAWAGQLGLTHEALYRTLKRLVAQGRVERIGRRGFRII
ncbi:Crp/Fnr family transcriptional regulator [Magnetospirillum sp. LM-5]|uniref:Crp/Fnr family transcriptional regulator n=1 Tax=Magnetospirillum sp. LM-5 TaxID=2681466 RepID=UPI0015710001|nr:Crp/Fnr family transcriptional regulator [Magnetospirillum sp. LM-5]